MPGVKDLSVLIVLLLGVLFYGCGENDKSSDTWDVTAALVQDTSPIYVFESKEMGRADSLFWAYELEEAEEIYDSIDSDQLSDIEKSIYFQRQTFSAARDKNMDLADSLLLKINLDSITIASYWNISLGHKLTQGIYSYWNWENEESRIYFENAFIQITLGQLQIQHWSAYIAHRLGLINFYRLRDAFLAKDWYEKEEELLRRLGNQNDLYYLLYSNLAACHRNIGDYEGALSYCLLSEEYLSKYTDASPRSEPLLYGEFANNYFYLGDTVNMIKYYDKAMKLYFENPALRGDRIRLTNTYGRLCRDMGLVEKTNSIYLELDSLLDITDTLSVIRHLELQADLAELKSEKENAIKCQRQAIELHQKYSGYDSLKQSILLTNIGSIYQTFEDHKLAIKSFEKSLSHQFGGEIEISNYMESLAGKNYLLNGGFYFEISPIAFSLQNLNLEGEENISSLKLAQRYYDFLQEIFDDMSKQRGQGVVLRDLEYFQKIFGEAISCSHKLQRQEGQAIQSNRIFDSMERGKAVLLYESILSKSLGRQLEIPEALINSIEKLNDERNQLERSFIKADFLDQKSINKLILNNEEKRIEVRKKINEISPLFFKRISESKLIALEDVIEWTSKNRKGVVQYHWSNDGLAMIIIAKDAVKFKFIDNFDSIEKQIQQFLELISIKPDFNVDHSQLIRKLSIDLGIALLGEDINIEAIESLVIIPDGLLSRLPFELLSLKEASNFGMKNINFLIKEIPISYAYSASTLLYADNQPLKGNGENIGLFAFGSLDNPTKELLVNRKDLVSLPGSEQEADALANMLQGNVRKWKKNSATKETFLREAPKQDILHLATHAEANSENRFANKIIFRNKAGNDIDELYAHELASMNFNADLVVLGACQTGRGEIKPGEGVYSIARSFMCADVHSVVMSLWNLDDQGAKRLNIGLYKHLQSGKPLDVSMREAKLEYLNSSNEFFSHPYFWAPLVSIGRCKSPFVKPWYWFW